jgi:hypothetical protein
VSASIGSLTLPAVAIDYASAGNSSVDETLHLTIDFGTAVASIVMSRLPHVSRIDRHAFGYLAKCSIMNHSLRHGNGSLKSMNRFQRVIPNRIKSAFVIDTAVGGCLTNYTDDHRPHIFG